MSLTRTERRETNTWPSMLASIGTRRPMIPAASSPAACETTRSPPSWT